MVHADKNTEHGENFSIAGGSANLYKCVGNNKFWCFLRNVQTDLLQDSDIPLLGRYTKDALPSHKDTYSTVFITALFVIARSWKKLDVPPLKKNG